MIHDKKINNVVSTSNHRDESLKNTRFIYLLKSRFKSLRNVHLCQIAFRSQRCVKKSSISQNLKAKI